MLAANESRVEVSTGVRQKKRFETYACAYAFCPALLGRSFRGPIIRERVIHTTRYKRYIGEPILQLQLHLSLAAGQINWALI